MKPEKEVSVSVDCYGATTLSDFLKEVDALGWKYEECVFELDYSQCYYDGDHPNVVLKKNEF